MRTFITIIALTFATVSCGNSKEMINADGNITENDQNGNGSVMIETSKESQSTQTVGKVRLSDTGCKVYIEVVGKNDKIEIYYPVNLDDEFKIDHAAILFDYNLSRAPMPEGCIADYTVTVSNVKRIRK